MEVKQPLGLAILQMMGYHKDDGKNAKIMAEERKEVNICAKKVLEEA
jgi:hypothetical protein